MAELEEGGPPQPMSVIEAAEWQVFFRLRAENMKEHAEQARKKYSSGNQTVDGHIRPNLNPPTMGGSGR